MRKVKAGKKGQATKYISRAKAIRKLQLSLKDFRRLCILKGVYPREPPKKLKKNNRTYYHLKDVNFLALDPLIAKLRAQKVYVRKYNHAKAKGNVGQIKYLTKHKPKISLNHLIRERYPDFIDALRDLDDPLSLMALFTIFPTHKEFNLSSEKIQACSKLLKYFQLYVVKKQCLKKVFVSIKGIYYQCQILGQKITYIVPYKYPPNMPIDVDYRVMSTFLDFYITLLKFVNYKLYMMEGLQYPPHQTEISENQITLGTYMCYQLHKVSKEAIQDDKYQIDQQFQQKNDQNTQQLIFKGLHFYLSTEVPREALEYTILSNGGTVTYQFDHQNQAITHVITDRQNPNIKVVKTKQYVQPQWVFDSLNFNKLLNVNEYWYNVKQLPAHISPFFEQKQLEQRYIPERQKQLRGLQDNQKIDQNHQENLHKKSNQRQKYDIEYQRQLQKKQKKKEQEELKFISKNIISNTNKKLLKVIDHGKKQKREVKQKLEQKAKQLKTKKIQH